MDKKQILDNLKDWFLDEDTLKMIASIVLLIVGVLILFSGIKGFDVSGSGSLFARNVIKTILGAAAGLFGLIPIIVAWCRWQDLD